MPDVRMPDGTIIRNVPEGTTKAQLLAKLQKHQQQQQLEKPYSDSKVALSSLVKGFAAIPDAIINTPANLANLGKAATGFVLNEAGQGDLAQRLGFNDMTEPPSPVTNAIRNTVGLFEPRTSGQRVMDWAVQGVSGAAIAPQSSAANIAKLMAHGGGSGAVGGLVSETTDSPIAGMLAATLAVPAASAGIAKVKSATPQLFTQKGREMSVAKNLERNIKDVPKAINTLQNAPKKPLVPSPDKMAGQDLPDGATPASLPTTAQLLAQGGDTQLLGLEKALREVPSIERDMINARYEGNANARNAQMDRIAPIPRESGADAVNASINKDIANKQAIADQQINNAQNTAMQARMATGQQVTPEQVGQSFLDDFDNLYAAQKQKVSNDFQVDPFNEITNLPLNKQAVANTIDEYYAGLKKPIPASVKQALGMIDEATGANTAKLAEDGGFLPPKQSKTDINPSLDDLLTAISKYGGMDRESAKKFGFDPTQFNDRAAFGKPIFPKKGGLSPDQLAELLSQHGYPVFENGLYTPNALLDSMGKALMGEKVYAPQAYDKGGIADASLSRKSQENNGGGFGDDLPGFDNPTPKETMTYKQMQTVASAIGDLQRSAGASGLMQDAAVLGRLKNIVRDAMSKEIEAGNVPQDIANNYQAGLLSRREQAQRFEEGAAGKMRQFNGQRKVKAKDAPDLLLRSGSENLASFNRSIGNEPVSRQAAQDYLAMKWRESVTNPADGSLKKDWRQASAVFLRENEAVIKQFPQLEKNLNQAIKQSRSAVELETKLNNAMKQIKTETGARFFLNGIDPKNAFDSFLRSKSRQKDGQYILNMAKKDKDFKSSVSGAIRDHIANLPSDQKRVAFIKDANNQRLIKGLFGEGMLKQWQKLSADIERDLLIQTKNISRGSDTVNKAAALKAAGKFSGNSKWTELFNDLSQYMGAKQRDALQGEALLDPQKAAELLQKRQDLPTFGQEFKKGFDVNRPQLLQIQNKGNDEFVDDEGNVYVRKINKSPN